MGPALSELLHVIQHDGDATPLLRSLGLVEVDAAQDAFVELWNAAAGSGRAPRLFERALGSAEPIAAATALSKLTTLGIGLEDDARIDAVVALATSSPQSLRTLLTLPRAADALRALDAAESCDSLRAQLTALLSEWPGDPAKALRRFRALAHARIAARDVLAAPMPEVLAELADVAEVSIDAAVELALREIAATHGAPRDAAGNGVGFVVLGMGKLGGRELNFSSDIDLIYVYETDEGQAVRADGVVETLHEHFARVARLATKLLAEATADGFAYRVDLNLRPEGKKGPLVNSVASMESYYESWGKTWERAAMLKARPVGGDRALGDRLLQGLAPFVYRRSLDASVFDEIREMKQRIDLDEKRRGGAWNVKLGRGGIRELEFFVQSHQLLLAGKKPGLRTRGTLETLAALVSEGVLSAREHDTLRDAYLFLRRLEHRIQMEEGRQTHRLPEHLEGRATLARRLGFAPGCPRTPDGPAAARLERSVLHHRRQVMAAFDGLLPESAAAPHTEARDDAMNVALALDPNVEEPAPDEATTGALSRLGLRDPSAAFAHLQRLGRMPGTPFHDSAPTRVRSLGPELLRSVRTSPDPDLALSHLTSLVAKLRGRYGSYALLRENPATLRALTDLFGTSDFLARLVVRRPELLDPLLIGVTSARRGGRELDLELGARTKELDDEARLDAWRAFHIEELLRIGLCDVAGTLDLRQVQGELTALAEAILRDVGEWALHTVLRKSPAQEGVDPADTTPTDAFCVVGMGKLGGGELNYNSDLDLLFLFPGDGQSNVAGSSRSAQEHFARISQKLLFALSCTTSTGVLYHIDARLRPSGRQGSLVSSLEAFARYHAHSAQIWERLALVRGRPVSGPEQLRAAAAAVLEAATYGRALPAGGAREIARLRARMEHENGREDEHRYNVKLGRGGLVDVEFATQLLQLRFGPEEPRVRVPGTFDALDALITVDAFDRGALVALREGYDFMRRLENRLRIVHDNAQSVLARDPAALDTLARRMHIRGAAMREAQGDGVELLRRYEAISARNRELYTSIVESMP